MVAGLPAEEEVRRAVPLEREVCSEMSLSEVRWETLGAESLPFSIFAFSSNLRRESERLDSSARATPLSALVMPPEESLPLPLPLQS